MGKTNFRQIFKGGYSRVFEVDDAPGVICKRQEKYTSGGLVLYSTLVDAIFMSSLRPIPGTPIVTSIDQTQRHIDVYMKHHGQTLTAWMRAHSPEARARHAPAILRAIWTILANMYHNGCMHTDLKPCNVLIADGDEPHVTLIDYNCVTIMGSHEVGLKYARAIGTWSHAPPEVVFQEQPYPQSPVWSLALIAAALYDRYPLPQRLTHDASGRWHTDRKSWRRIMNQMMEAHPGGVPLDGALGDRLGPALFECVSQSLMWRPEARANLAKWHTTLFAAPAPAPTPTRYILDRNVDPTLVPADKRAVAIQQIYLLSSECGVPHWFSHAVFLFDRCGRWLAASRHSHACVAATCWCLVGFLNNTYVADEPSMVAKLAVCGFEAESQENGLRYWAYRVAAALNYNAWVKPVDVRIHEALGSGRRPSIDWLLERWLAVDRPYTLAILAAQWAADLKARPQSRE